MKNIFIAITLLTLLNTQAQNSEKATYLDVSLDFETRAIDLVIK